MMKSRSLSQFFVALVGLGSQLLPIVYTSASDILFFESRARNLYSRIVSPDFAAMISQAQSIAIENPEMSGIEIAKRVDGSFHAKALIKIRSELIAAVPPGPDYQAQIARDIIQAINKLQEKQFRMSYYESSAILSRYLSEFDRDSSRGMGTAHELLVQHRALDGFPWKVGKFDVKESGEHIGIDIFRKHRVGEIWDIQVAGPSDIFDVDGATFEGWRALFLPQHDYGHLNDVPAHSIYFSDRGGLYSGAHRGILTGPSGKKLSLAQYEGYLDELEINLEINNRFENLLASTKNPKLRTVLDILAFEDVHENGGIPEMMVGGRMKSPSTIDKAYLPEYLRDPKRYGALFMDYPLATDEAELLVSRAMVEYRRFLAETQSLVASKLSGNLRKQMISSAGASLRNVWFTNSGTMIQFDRLESLGLADEVRATLINDLGLNRLGFLKKLPKYQSEFNAQAKYHLLHFLYPNQPKKADALFLRIIKNGPQNAREKLSALAMQQRPISLRAIKACLDAVLKLAPSLP